MYKLRLLLKHYHAGASKRWLAGVLEISRSTLNVYWTRIAHLNLSCEEWEALSDLEVSRLLFNPLPAAPADPRSAMLTAMLPQINKDLKKKVMMQRSARTREYCLNASLPTPRIRSRATRPATAS